MADKDEQIEAWASAYRNIFAEINGYNKTVISLGFIAFFSLAAFVQESAPPKIFIGAIALMSLSMGIFVFYELLFAYSINRYASGSARAIEDLPDENPLKSVNCRKTVWEVRLQKWNASVFLSSLTLGLLSLVLLFYCYWVMLLR